METDLGVITWEYEIVPVIVGNQCVLVPVIQGVQKTVGVLFRLIEPNDIVLVLVAQAVPEKTHRAVGVCKDETSEVAAEKLRARPNRNEIVIRTRVGDLGFIKPFLERPKSPMPIRAVGHIRRNNSQFINLEIVLIENHIDLETPIKRSKNLVPFEKIDRCGIVLSE